DARGRRGDVRGQERRQEPCAPALGPRADPLPRRRRGRRRAERRGVSAARVQAGARAAVDALVRACASVRLYGPGHAVARGACESCASALAGLLAAATPATLRVTPAALVLESDGSREEAGGGELAAALHARNIGSLRVETAPTGADVERLGLALAASG